MNLGKRLDGLEQLAEQVRRREIRELIASLPDANDLTPAELESAIDEYTRAVEQIAGWRREGATDRQVLQRIADEIGTDAEALEAECRALAER